MIYYFYEIAFMCAIIDKKLCSIAFVTCRNYIDEDCIVRFGYNTICKYYSSVLVYQQLGKAAYIQNKCNIVEHRIGHWIKHEHQQGDNGNQYYEINFSIAKSII